MELTLVAANLFFPCGLHGASWPGRRRTACTSLSSEEILVVVLGSADHPSRYNDMRAILAALPHDFPELAEPATGPAQASGAKSCQ
jgi:hypothetical protein